MPVGANEPEHTFCRLFRLPVRQYVVELEFDPACPPDHVESFVGDSAANEVAPPKPLSLDRHARTHAVTLDFGMGVFGVRWQPSRRALLDGR